MRVAVETMKPMCIDCHVGIANQRSGKKRLLDTGHYPDVAQSHASIIPPRSAPQLRHIIEFAD